MKPKVFIYFYVLSYYYVVLFYFNSIKPLTTSNSNDKILNLSGKVIIEIKDLLQKRVEDHQINSTATLQSINTLGNYYKLLGFKKVYFN
jgi:hypothetical protein